MTFILLSTLSSFAQIPKLTSSLNEYSFDLYKVIKNDYKNTFFSPISTYLALSLAYEGAKSETKCEFDKVLHVASNEMHNDILKFINTSKIRIDSLTDLNISNAIWIPENIKIERTYKDIIHSKYSAEVKSADFSNKNKTVSEINQWVSIKTNDLINEIISPYDINEYTRIIITNAIFFIGKWANQFDKDLTKKDVFYSINKEKVQVDFMNQTEYLNYYENDDFKFVCIPYKKNYKSFCIILPKKRYGIFNTEMGFDKSLIDTIFNNIDYLKVHLSIPKIKLKICYSLIEPLVQLGLKTPFTSRADFSGITLESPLIINKINHTAFFEIDEEKTVASAETIVSMMTGSVRGKAHKTKVFKANHPFIFMILDNKTKMILFMGRYVKL